MKNKIILSSSSSYCIIFYITSYYATMRFSTSCIAVLSLNSLSWFVQGDTVPSIDRYQILAVGNGGEKDATSPYGVVLGLEPFYGKAYIESHPYTFLEADDENYIPMTVELFAGVPSGADCDKGTLLESSSENGIETEFYADDASYTLSTSNGGLGVAAFSLEKFRGDLAAAIFTLSETDIEAGTIDVCVRTSIKMAFEGDKVETVSFVDTRLNVDVDLTANFAGFNQVVGLNNAASSSNSELSVVRTIDVESFMCGEPDKNDGKPAENYRIGQNFQVCVGPTLKYATDYSVKKFKFVTCGEGDNLRVLKTQYEQDFLTDIITDLTGSKSSAGVPASPNSIAFRSVLTPGYFTGGQTQFSCNGEVELQYAEAAGDGTSDRRLVAIFSDLSLRGEDIFRDLFRQETTTLGGDLLRDLQETTTSEEIELTEFDVVVRLARDNSLTGPGVATCHSGWSSILVASTAVVLAVV